MNSKQSVVTVSEYSKNKINMNMGIKPNFINLIYNGAKIPSIDYTLQTKKMILTVGHVVEYKNPHTWYQVVKKVITRIPSAKFFWVGEGPLLEKMRIQIINDKLDKNIIFTGLQSKMDDFYRQSTIYFHPSLIENHSISIIEAMSFALPCIGSNIGGTPESIVDGETGFLCDADDVEDFTEKLCYLLENPKVSQAFGLKGREVMINKFNEDDQEKSILAMYDKALAD